MPHECSHMDQIRVTRPPERRVCEECERMGDQWVSLRMCLACGNVGCCDSSKNRHATAHYRHTEHALMRSIEPGQSWVWCYVDEFSPGEISDDADQRVA